MKKKDETLQWIEQEIKRVKSTAFRYNLKEAGTIHRSIDVASQKQLDQLEKQKAEYLKSIGLA
jgi:hypothetical protein